MTEVTPVSENSTPMRIGSLVAGVHRNRFLWFVAMYLLFRDRQAIASGKATGKSAWRATAAVNGDDQSGQAVIALLSAAAGGNDLHSDALAPLSQWCVIL